MKSGSDWLYTYSVDITGTGLNGLFTAKVDPETTGVQTCVRGERVYLICHKPNAKPKMVRMRRVR